MTFCCYIRGTFEILPARICFVNFLVVNSTMKRRSSSFVARSTSDSESSEDELDVSIKRSCVSFQNPSLPILRDSQSLRSSGTQISNTPFDDISEEAICAIFSCLPPKVRKIIALHQRTGNLSFEYRLQKLVPLCLR